MKKILIYHAHIPENREGENRAIRIVDDIFTILTHLDENLKF